VGWLLASAYGTNWDCTVGVVILQETVTQSWKYVHRLARVMGQGGQNIVGKLNILRYKHSLTALTETIGMDGRCATSNAGGTGIWIHEAIYSRPP